MNQLKCYRVKLPTTNALHSVYETKDGNYMSVKDEAIYTVAYSMLEVGEVFPDAIWVEEVGLGHICGGD